MSYYINTPPPWYPGSAAGGGALPGSTPGVLPQTTSPGINEDETAPGIDTGPSQPEAPPPPPMLPPAESAPSAPAFTPLGIAGTFASPTNQASLKPFRTNQFMTGRELFGANSPGVPMAGSGVGAFPDGPTDPADEERRQRAKENALRAYFQG
jgi:hypothetical protein